MVIDFFILKLSKTIISNDYLLFSKFLKELILWRLWVFFFFPCLSLELSFVTKTITSVSFNDAKIEK